MSTFDQKNFKTSYVFLPLIYFDRFLRLENYNWEYFSKEVMVTTTSWMTLKNSFSFHQVFAPLPTSQSSTSSSLRAQNHNQGPVWLTGLFKAPSKASSAQAEAEGTQPQTDLALVKAEQDKVFSKVHVCQAAQGVHLQFPATTVLPLTPWGWTTSPLCLLHPWERHCKAPQTDCPFEPCHVVGLLCLQKSKNFYFHKWRMHITLHKLFTATPEICCLDD